MKYSDKETPLSRWSRLKEESRHSPPSDPNNTGIEQAAEINEKILEKNEDAEPAAVSGQKSFVLLSELLLADYEQSLALASKEDELNHMTDELTRRYEELNLIYKAEDQAMNIYHGRELLRQLVMNTSRFLNVDIIYLYIGGKNIAMHKFRSDNPVFLAIRPEDS